jgi:hypothetical protein
MPFIAECLFCHGKLRAPDHAAGWSVPCPTCGNQFTLVPMAHPPEHYKVTTAAGAPATPAAAAAGLVHADSQAALPPRVQPLPPPPFVAAEEAAARSGPRYLGVAALFLGSVALLCAYLPGPDVLTLPCSGLGLAAGLAGVLWALSLARPPILPLAGTVVSGVVLAIACLWPGVFNPLYGGRADQPTNQPRAVPMGRGSTGRSEAPAAEDAWVDASHEAEQRGDVRVRVLAVAVRAVPFKDPARARAARDRQLLITLRVYNLGAERRIPYESWGEPAAGREADLPQLHDGTGKTYRLWSFDPGVEVVGRTPHARLSPGKYVDDLLVFEPPTVFPEYLRLELPASACGASGTFRLQLPREMVQYR